jgi:hypothetical protein
MFFVDDSPQLYGISVLHFDGALRGISPTLPNILKLGLPEEMTGGDLRVPIRN